MSDVDPRRALEALILTHREDYAALSRLIGRNAAYVQQYVKRGTPKRLAEADRRILADYFGVPESVLGGPPAAAPRVIAASDPGARRVADLIAVPRLGLGASAGPGAHAEAERAEADMLFPAPLLRELGVGRTAALSLIKVAGESMLPTLGDGDDILVDGDDGAARLRDGIYVLRVSDALIVKRVAIGPAGLAILSDNPQSPDWRDVDPESLVIVGRVIWAGRRLR